MPTSENNIEVLVFFFFLTNIFDYLPFSICIVSASVAFESTGAPQKNLLDKICDPWQHHAVVFPSGKEMK